MERKQFLILCQKNAVFPKSSKIKYHNAQYYPLALYIWFDNKGNTQNTAVVEDVKSNSITYAKIQEIEDEH